MGKGVLGKAVFHQAGDVGKQNFLAQKGGDGDFVGSIEHARGSAAKIERVVGEFEAGEAGEIGLLEGERGKLAEIQRCSA